MSRSRLDPTGLRAAVLLALAVALANGIWILIDRTAPSWDQAHYLDATWHYQQAFAGQGLGSLTETIQTLDPGHGPLFTTVLLPFFYLLSDVARSGAVLNLILAPVLYLSAGEIAMHLFGSWRARLLTILLVATMPLMVGLLHNALQDFPLATLATLSLLILLKTDLFQRRWMSLALGVTMGLGTLTKVTFPAFVAGPLLVILAQLAASAWADRKHPDRPARIDLRRVAVNLGAAALVYCALVLPWYLTNLSATIDYVRSTTNGPLAEGVGPSNPYTFHAIFSFTVEVVNSHVSWIIALSGLIAICLNWRRLSSWFSRPIQTQRLVSVAFLLAWVLIPYLSLALGHNQDIRLMAPAMPGIAVIVASAIAGIELPRLRLALAGLVVATMAYQVANHVTPLRPGFAPRQIELQLGYTTAAIPLDSRPVGYEVLPGSDYGTPIFRYLESVARERAHSDDVVPLSSVCLLQSDAVVNLNTFAFLADTRGDPFELQEPLFGPEGRAGLARTLAGCDFALYAPPPPITADSGEDRVALVNASVAAHYMTPKLFDLYEHPARRFPVSKSALSGNPADDLNGTSSDWVSVLVRR